MRGKTRPTPDGKPSAEALEELHDLRATAMLNRAGIWQATQPRLLVEMRKRQREEARKLKEFQQSVAGGPLGADGPIDLNSASRKEAGAHPPHRLGDRHQDSPPTGPIGLSTSC